MRVFEYKIKDPLGIHARPAGMIAKAAKEFQSEITIVKDGKTAGATRIMSLMGLGIKCGDVVTIEIDGNDEDAAERAMRDLFEANL